MKRPTCAAIFALICIGPFGLPILAGTSVDVRVPNRGQARVSGNALELRIQSRWVEGSGYRPVFVELSSLAPAKADRTFTVELTPNDRRYSVARPEGVQFQMTLGEGRSVSRKEVSILQGSPWNYLSVRVEEEGTELEDLSQDRSSIGRRTGSHDWSEIYPSILFIDSDADTKGITRGSMKQRFQLPDVLAFCYLVPPWFQNHADLINDFRSRKADPDDYEIRTTVDRLTKMEIVPPALLPSLWRNYSSVDIIVIHRDDLIALTEQHVDKWKAIEHHIAAGGLLWVYGMSPQFGDLDVIEKPFGTHVQLDWQEPNPKNAGGDSQMGFQRSLAHRSYRGRSDRDGTILAEWAGLGNNGAPQALVNDSRFQICRYQLGRIAAIGTDELASLTKSITSKNSQGQVTQSDRMSWLLTESSQGNWAWCLQTGMSLRRTNRDFWNLLIPGVGAAPVQSFLVLITGFMIVIGPINYFVLRRSRKLYLLLVTVPLGALLFTLGLYSYAFVKDGLGTRVRARSFSTVDDSGLATSWSRQSYYAGLAPASGLTYPASAIVYPVSYDPARRGGRRVMRMGSESYRYVPGYLKSRETCQTLVIDREQVTALVDIESRDDEIIVTNRLGEALTCVLAVKGGQVHWAHGVRPEETTVLEAVRFAEARTHVVELLQGKRPEPPPGFAAPRTSRWARYYFGQCDANFPAPTFETSLLERKISEVPDEFLTAGTHSGRHYVLICERAPRFVPLGVAGAQQTAGLHVVRGQW